MDNITFNIKNLEFHINQKSIIYDQCVSKSIKQFLESNETFENLIKPCEVAKKDLDDLMKKYEEINKDIGD